MDYLDENKGSKAKNMFLVIFFLYTYVYTETCISFPKVAHSYILNIKSQKYFQNIVMTKPGFHIRENKLRVPGWW